MRLALVDDDLARLAGLGGLDRYHLLACPGRADLSGVKPEVSFDLAAMIPLNDGYLGSTTPAVTVTTAGSEQVTSS